MTRQKALGRVVLAASGIVLAVGCGQPRLHQVTVPVDLAWPAADPRVRLERIIESGTDGGGLIGGIFGTKASAVLQRPYAVAWHEGQLYVTDPALARVARIADDGAVTFSPRAAVGDMVGIAICGGRVLVTESRSGRVRAYDLDLSRPSTLIEGLQRPTGIACDDQAVYVVETGAHRVLVLNSDGTQRTFGGRGDAPGEFNYPTVVALHDGDLWVGDTLNFRVQRLDAATGDFRATFGHLGDVAGELPRIKGLAVDDAGHLWVSDGVLDQVALYQSDGTFLMSIGGSGDGMGAFSFPAGIASTGDGRVVVVDSLNRRIQVFRLLPHALNH